MTRRRRTTDHLHALAAGFGEGRLSIFRATSSTAPRCSTRRAGARESSTSPRPTPSTPSRIPEPTDSARGGRHAERAARGQGGRGRAAGGGDLVHPGHRAQTRVARRRGPPPRPALLDRHRLLREERGEPACLRACRANPQLGFLLASSMEL
ncbi:hypothetical protein BS78_01G133600 [Paspalum vaginatum]|nr:hypothetical protein BS78_01G133600 [Paspalum vaginatum]